VAREQIYLLCPHTSTKAPDVGLTLVTLSRVVSASGIYTSNSQWGPITGGNGDFGA
jgi:hypothetical protein